VTVKEFKTCCTSNAVDGREDEKKAENVGSESDEVGNCEDSETNW
jgi:hypothetical protein